MLQPAQRGGPATPARCGLPTMVCVCAIQNFYRARTTAPGLERTSTRDGGLRARRIAASSASPGARQEGVARASLQISPVLSMHRHPQGYALCRLAHFARHAQKSMQRLAGLCTYYGPYCILRASPPEKYAAPHWLMFALRAVLHTLHTFRTLC